MKKFLFLSSAFIMTTLGAFGADGTITGGAGTCTFDVLGVSDNNATANTIATWTLNEYECGAGQYLLNSDGTLKCTECPVGSYCPGGKFTVESDNKGANACPTDYTSDAAATAETECYMGCELECTQQTCPEHSENCTHGVSSTNGKQYVGGTCNAEKTFCSINFECAPGYNKTIANSEFIAKATSTYSSNNLRHVSCNLNKTSSANTFWNLFSIDSCDSVEPGEAITIGYDSIDDDMSIFYPNYYIRWQISYNNHDINSDDVIRKQYNNSDGNAETFAYTYNTNFTREITGTNVWVKPVSIFLMTPTAKMIADILINGITYSETNILWNQLHASVSDLEFTAIQKLSNGIGVGSLSKEEAWALFFTSSTIEVPLNYPWIFVGESNDDTSNNYALNLLGKGTDYVFGIEDPTKNPLVQFLPDNGATYCMSNAININWNPDNGTDALQSMCMYNDGLAVPDDPVKPGYTFTGWKLVE